MGLERHEGKSLVGPAGMRTKVQILGSALRKWHSPREKWLSGAS